jgi:CO dehydrogenase maturation factor
MKIAFVGKGGSGKSTLSSLFIRYLQHVRKRNVLAIDADLNMNLAGLLGVKVEEGTLMARPEVAEAIRSYLKGENQRITEVAKFLPTTPPATGSNLVKNAAEPGILPFCAKVSDSPIVNLLTVGSYDKDGIGQTCYHSHLFVAENILSHTVTSPEFTIVCDMVAGTDAFAYSMHLQFDAIVLIAEPTPESTEVCKLYVDLARQSGVDELIHLVGNKVEDAEDNEFICKAVDKKLLVSIPALPRLKKSRQRGEIVAAELLDPALTQIMRIIENEAHQPLVSPARRLEMLHKLHLKLNEKQWVQTGYGDVAGQIDPDFQYLPEFAGAL